ncbi:MAG TPA: hypothetical protein VNG51_26020 [Ktedonobacteraceae bacterium]|nr:hypothetical protein [Ktedonobacteraceae bacterium]
MQETTVLFRPIGSKELVLIRESNYTAFPPRLFWQPIFYPVLNEEYATQIARDWNARDGNNGYVTRFSVRMDFLQRYEVHQVGSAINQEYWIPAEELEEFNRNIVGPIEVIAEFQSSLEMEMD